MTTAVRTAIGGGGGGLGYASTPGNPAFIASSAAIALFSDTGPGLTYNGFWTGGTLGGGNQATTPVSAFEFRDLNVTVTYSNPVLSVMIDDPVIPGGIDFSRNYVVGNLAATVGSSTAYIGFTASTGDNFGNGGSNQYLSNFVYSVPAPGAALLLGLAGIASSRCRR